LHWSQRAPSRLLLSRLQAAFPKGLLDRAFYARVACASDLKARFNGLKLNALALDIDVTNFQSTLKRAKHRAFGAAQR
jgi:hypothetical protein